MQKLYSKNNLPMNGSTIIANMILVNLIKCYFKWLRDFILNKNKATTEFLKLLRNYNKQELEK